VRFLAFDVGNKANSAGVMFIPGVVEPLGWRWTVAVGSVRHRHKYLAETGRQGR